MANVIPPADRPRNIVYTKILDTAADVDVALRVITVIEDDDRLFAAIDATDKGAFLLSAEELIDSCNYGCVFVLITDSIRWSLKPIAWYVDSSTGIACTNIVYYDGINAKFVSRYVYSAEAYLVPGDK